MTARDGSYGRASFVERFGLRGADARKRADEVIGQIEAAGLDSLRLSFADQHGILRGKTVMARDAAQVMGSGCSMTSTLLVKDTSHRTVYPVWSDGGGLDMPEMTGGRRLSHGARSGHVPDSAVDRKHRVDAVRHLLSRRPSRTVLHESALPERTERIIEPRVRVARRT